MLKLSDEELEALQNSIGRTEASDLIKYYENQKSEQKKRDTINLVVSIVAMVASVISVVIGLISLFI